MTTQPSAIRGVSDTAFWVAVYRAMETARPDPLFHDPLAEVLAGERGKQVSQHMQPFQRFAYWSITIRTRLIDDLLREHLAQGYRTVINLGAGLDTRPYRLDLPPDLHWIEIDAPEVIAFKQEKLKGRTPDCRLERIGLDLADHEARTRCLSEINDRVGPTLLLTEGVMPYLEEEAVRALACDLWGQSNFALWISEYYSPESYRHYQSPKFKQRMGSAAFRFFPEDWFALFESCGWRRKEIRYLYDVAQAHGRDFPIPWWAKLVQLIVGKERTMAPVKTLSAYAVLEKC